MKQAGFWSVFFGWLVFAVAAYGINHLTIQNALLQRCVMASLGVVLWIRPVWPRAFEVYYDDVTCRRLIRVCAAVEIISSFTVRSFF